ncbi:hypothetical protein C8R44DRAFT_754500 [Mycena epipterygia]|nr:hypothetical protein C8R44DRAFT_754500 [Mycena epipterygia]
MAPWASLVNSGALASGQFFLAMLCMLIHPWSSAPSFCNSQMIIPRCRLSTLGWPETALSNIGYPALALHLLGSYFDRRGCVYQVPRYAVDFCRLDSIIGLFDAKSLLGQFYLPKPKWWQEDIPDLTGEVMLVTGTSVHDPARPDFEFFLCRWKGGYREGDCEGGIFSSILALYCSLEFYALLQHNATVYLAARGKEDTEEVIDELKRATGPPFSWNWIWRVSSVSEERLRSS